MTPVEALAVAVHEVLMFPVVAKRGLLSDDDAAHFILAALSPDAAVVTVETLAAAMRMNILALYQTADVHMAGRETDQMWLTLAATLLAAAREVGP